MAALLVATGLVALAKLGDKTQITTIVLAARYQALTLVMLGTTLGMMIANVPAVMLGERIAQRIPTHWIHGVAAIVFALLGIAVLMGLGEKIGL